jgi:hypothetical protein
VRKGERLAPPKGPLQLTANTAHSAFSSSERAVEGGGGWRNPCYRGSWHLHQPSKESPPAGGHSYGTYFCISLQPPLSPHPLTPAGGHALVPCESVMGSTCMTRVCGPPSRISAAITYGGGGGRPCPSLLTVLYALRFETLVSLTLSFSRSLAPECTFQPVW